MPCACSTQVHKHFWLVVRAQYNVVPTDLAGSLSIQRTPACLVTQPIPLATGAGSGSATPAKYGHSAAACCCPAFGRFLQHLLGSTEPGLSQGLPMTVAL